MTDHTDPTGEIVHIKVHVGAGDSPVTRAAHLEAVRNHSLAAAREARILLERTRRLTEVGVDLRDPDRMADYLTDQVQDAVKGSIITGCSCDGDESVAAVYLLAQLARINAERPR